MIFVGQIVASKKFMVSLGFDQEWIYIFFGPLLSPNTVLGGLQAVIATDIIQALFFIVVFFCGFLFAANDQYYSLWAL